uniref:Uncharacterized protein n=1 Tax=Lotharella oceanica TaxID=641309 RepID=A0A7S2TIV2_9EUKA
MLLFSPNTPPPLPIELSRNLDDRRERRKVQRRIIFCWLAVLFLFGTYAIEHLPLERVRSHYIWLLLAQTLALQLTSWAVVNNFSSPWEKSRRHSLSKASRRSSQCTLDQSHAHAGIVTLPRGTQLRVPGVRVNVRSPKTPHGSSEAKSQTNTHTRTHTRRSSRSQVLMFPRSPPCRIAEFAEIKRHRRMSSRGMASVSVSMYEGGAGTPERPSDFESIKELHVNKKAAVHLRFPEAEALPDHLG